MMLENESIISASRETTNNEFYEAILRISWQCTAIKSIQATKNTNVGK
jgi:hypothetical protein